MPILTVTAAATSRSLVLLETVKGELGIADTASDAELTRWIADESGRITDHCNVAADQLGRRTFAAETMTVKFDASEIDARCDRAPPLILPWRVPVVAVVSVVESGVTLEAADYEVEPMAAMLYRLNADGSRARWAKSRIVVTMTAGWDLTAEQQPEPLRRACVELVKARWYADGRDPMIKSESVDGVGDTAYWVGGVGQAGALPPDVAGMIEPYRMVAVA